MGSPDVNLRREFTLAALKIFGWYSDELFVERFGEPEFGATRTRGFRQNAGECESHALKKP